MEVAWLVAAYFCGSIPFGVLVTRWRRGVDVRSQGSGNIGATNVARVAGKGLGAVVLILDALKALVPLAVVTYERPEALWLHAGVALAAFFGHVFPVWLRFRGGKGVATALGILLWLVPAAAAVGGLVWASCYALFRVSSIGSLLGGLAALGVAAMVGAPQPYVVLSAGLLALMVFTHRGNIRRLLRKEERKV